MDICGNASPIMLDKDAQIKSNKCGSPSSSSSGSESSSSGLCLMVFICICLYHYRHSCVKKVLLFFPVLYCKFFENMDIISSRLFVGSVSYFYISSTLAVTYKFGKELKVEEQTCYSI